MRAALALLVVLAACGDNIRPAGDASVRPDAEVFMLCGNGIVEGSEDCDDGNTDPDDGCSPTCGFECGDGEVSGSEQCDIAIASGDPGACATATTCTDADSCTTAIVSGAGCEVTCEFAETTALIDGDDCCPAGGDATTDDDCAAVCGNGTVETPEVCDTGIATGFGACPTVCNDGQNCTIDALVGAGCDATCTTTDITAIGPADTCCPSGATPGTDVDCAGCGDGTVVSPETCDTAIPSGAGACPVACNDGNACTVDTLVNAGTCSAACATSPTAPGPMDGCCPVGSDLGDDPDCPPACGDGVVTAPETCDDSNTTGSDGCSASCRIEPIGFRFSDLDLRDPHTYASVPFLGCTDVTNLSLFGNNGVNPTLQINIQQDDADADTLLDLSIANTFNPLVQTAGSSTASDLTFPDCTAPMSTTSCTLPSGATHIPATATNAGSGAICLGTVAGTTNASYTPALVVPTAPTGGTCYSAVAGTVTFNLGGIPITLTDAQIGGEWFGSPATEIRDGMIRGFLSQASADATIIPEGTTGIDSIDGSPLSSLLRGGTGNCQTPAPMTGDKDTGPGGVAGWYFYLNFTAIKRPYTEL